MHHNKPLEYHPRVLKYVPWKSRFRDFTHFKILMFGSPIVEKERSSKFQLKASVLLQTITREIFRYLDNENSVLLRRICAAVPWDLAGICWIYIFTFEICLVLLYFRKIWSIFVTGRLDLVRCLLYHQPNPWGLCWYVSFSLPPLWSYTLINWVGGQCRNILPTAFSVLTDRREVNAVKAKGSIFLHWPTNSVRALLPYLQIPTTSLKK